MFAANKKRRRCAYNRKTLGLARLASKAKKQYVSVD